MTLREFRELHPGDRIRLSLWHPRGTSIRGTVSQTSPGRVSVVWDGEPVGSYLRNSYFYASWVAARGYLRRLHRLIE
jgi:hypothetical protein